MHYVKFVLVWYFGRINIEPTFMAMNSSSTIAKAVPYSFCAKYQVKCFVYVELFNLYFALNYEL